MTEKYSSIIMDSFSGYYHYLISEVTNLSWTNYLYWLLALSLLVWIAEIVVPWRKQQKILRSGFWLDNFYILFNFFLFSLIGYNALSNVGVELFSDFLLLWGIENIVAIEVGAWPIWSQLLLMFILADFIQWNVHRQLHKRPWLWEFHKIHHSVKEMGFAAQFRFHFMETIIYKSAQYIPLAIIGFGIKEFFVIHMFAVFIGHLNHANVDWDYGRLGYLFNNPKMHIWHHARRLPAERPYGVNFGLSLSLWDFLFGTAWTPQKVDNVDLGFEGDEYFPENFAGQTMIPFKNLSKLTLEVKPITKNRYNENKTV